MAVAGVAGLVSMAALSALPPGAARAAVADSIQDKQQWVLNMLDAAGAWSVTKGAGLEWPGAHLNIALGSTNTTVLLLSSVTCQMGVFAVERGQISRTRSLIHPLSWGLREWYVLTFLMGLYFDLGQSYEYFDLVTKEGLTLASSAYGSVFYIPTGFHGLHVAGGLIAFIFLLGRTYAARTFTHEQQVSAIVVSYYWHFVDVVWIGLFTVIYLIH